MRNTVSPWPENETGCGAEIGGAVGFTDAAALALAVADVVGFTDAGTLAWDVAAVDAR
jgi:hypothetical protein